ncbi:hypothetical protein BDP81DRAFT_421933 [Colletotrichum phormii]|uniref:Uncharacterized protein n=1 Tax=Colletotrichum phormii TaxID=359342 RepID=A0AAJ0EKE5_9PEZI|nr:uncharacterized protein BDP81DRAFT_421933 [Colletotrichum phormii]KAK1639835.1 hypothetical protein BDP81DRAFT_421933 [Colletotrichum phormii]
MEAWFNKLLCGWPIRVAYLVGLHTHPQARILVLWSSVTCCHRLATCEYPRLPAGKRDKIEEIVWRIPDDGRERTIKLFIMSKD